jgi:hypothetical protein
MRPPRIREGVQALADLAQQALLPVTAIGAIATGVGDILPVDAVALPSQDNGHLIEHRDTPRLRNINQLPGFKLKVTKGEENELDNATLKLTVSDYSASTQTNPSGFGEWCTILDVSIPGVNNDYGLSANHCFAAATGSTTGSFSNPLEPGFTALNYIDETTQRFNVIDPHVAPSVRDEFPIGQVNGISIDTAGVDQALLALNPPNTSDQTVPYAGERPLADVPAVPITKLVTAAKEPIVGQQVALYGIPAVDGNIPVATTGRYIGRYTLDRSDEAGPALINSKLDLVAVPAAIPEEDPCEHGSSGGSAITATGPFFGSLSYRFSTGYGPQHRYDPPDQPGYNQYMIANIERALDVKIPLGDTVCGFSVLPKNIGYTLLAGLNSYFFSPKDEEK